MSESLVQYGTSFQSKLIVSLMMDVKYTTTIIDILDVSYFDSDANKFLVKSIKDYFLKYKSPPTIEALKVMIDEDSYDSLRAISEPDHTPYKMWTLNSKNEMKPLLELSDNNEPYNTNRQHFIFR